MSLIITQRRIGNAVILACSGRLTQGEGARDFVVAVHELVAAGNCKLVLNLDEVSYIDSTGIGELVSALTMAERAGGSLKLTNVGGRVADLLKCTKLYSVYEVFSDEVAAAASFSISPRSFTCPVCGGHVPLPSPGANVQFGQWCSNCECSIGFNAVAVGDTAVKIKTITARASYESYVMVNFGKPVRLIVHGHVNLFTSSFIRKAWSAIPKFGAVLIDLSQANEIETAGADAILELVSYAGPAFRVAVSLDGLDPRAQNRCPSGAPFFREEALAIESLAPLPDASGLVLSVEQA